jgi:DNA-binding Lrp family transcriptional regulator
MRMQRKTHDNINRAIIAELLKDANINIKGLSNKIKVPFSTVQRRTRELQSSSVLTKRFHIDIGSYLGLRRGDIIINVDKGKTKQVIQRILQNYIQTNILSISTRLNHTHNIVVSIVYKGEDELYEIIENIKSMPNVIGLEWSETVQDIEYTDAIENLVRKKI